MSRGIDIAIKIESPDFIRLEKTFQELKYADKKKIINKAFRRAVRPTVLQAQANVSVKTGNLRRSIGVLIPRNELAIIVGARRRHGWKGFHGHLVEDGTVDRYVKRKKKGGELLSKPRFTGRMKSQGSYAGFLRKAVEATGNQALNIMAEEWYSEIEKFHRKNGL